MSYGDSVVGAGFSVPCVKRPDLLPGLSLCTEPSSFGLFPQSRPLAYRLTQPGVLGRAATVNGFEANRADSNIGFAARGKLFPVPWTFAAAELLTAKNPCHGRKLA